jgi:amidohydrolase
MSSVDTVHAIPAAIQHWCGGRLTFNGGKGSFTTTRSDYMKSDLVEQLCPKDLVDRLIELRHALHGQPELSFQENRTSDRLHAELERLEPLVLARVAGTGLLARIAGRNSRLKPVAIRGDIDALPIREETGAKFASAVDGVMHACGHDVHAAWTVGAAHLLAQDPPPGDVVVLLQPGEETGRGAPAMIEAGSLEGVAAIFGGHVDMRFETGTVVAQSGNVSASADEFAIELIGRGCHAARPNEGTDPIVGLAALVTSLQTIVARRVPPGVPAVVSVGTVEAGTAANIIPDTARMTGTLRAADSVTRDLLHEQVRRMSNSVAQAHQLESKVSLDLGTPPLVNESGVMQWVRETILDLLGDGALCTLPVPNLGGEDFAFYLEKVPGCFVRIGGRRSDQAPVPAHTSRFLPDDEAVIVGAAVLAGIARAGSRHFNA